MPSRGEVPEATRSPDATTTSNCHAQTEQEAAIARRSSRCPTDSARPSADRLHARNTANDTRQSTPISLNVSLVHRAHGPASTCDQLVLSRNAISKLAKEKSTPSVEVLQDHHVLHRIGKAEPFSISSICRSGDERARVHGEASAPPRPSTFRRGKAC